MATTNPSAPSNDALCSIAAYLKLAGKTDSKLPDNFISGENTLDVGDGNCDTRKDSDSSCACDEGTLDLSSYSKKEYPQWVSEDICNYMKDEYIPYLQSELGDSDVKLAAAVGYRCYESIVCGTAELDKIEAEEVLCGEDPLSSAGDGSEWDDMKNAAEENYDEIKESINKWKTKAMDQYLLNTDVYLYDFANRESKAGKGPFECRMLEGNPCCIPEDIWNKQDPRDSQVQTIIDEFIAKKGKNRKKIKCHDHFGLQHDYGNGLEDQCRHENDEGVECEEKFQDWCLYDKNGAACCTKKFDLVKGWLDAGYIGKSPFHNFIDLFDKSVAKAEEGKGVDYWKLVKKMQWTIQPSTIYHVDGVDKQHKFMAGKTRWNFECPTHHPVPKVAIILGCFIPVMFILLVIVIIQFVRGRNAKPAKEEEAAVDEIPPSAK